ncbi:MAG: glycosyltransferase [Patescibacteria group bacterium]
MKILFLAQHKWPHIGGVEKHIRAVSEELRKKNYDVKIISEEDIKYPKIKFLGLLYIWFWLFKNRNLITGSHLVHIHDVFVWYLPFRFLYPRKPVFTTFHGWEGVYPIPWKNIFLKRIANRLSWASIVIGKYIEKYYGIKANRIMYGGTRQKALGTRKIKNMIVWLGRQDKDTGINEFKKWIKKQNKKYLVTYVSNELNPEKYLRKAEYCVPGGYLSYIEAKSYGSKIMTFANNPLKEDYWNEIRLVKNFPTWGKVADEYINLYNSIK